MRDDRPVFARDKPLDLDLAVADDAQRNRLHAPRRARARQLAPQHRRQAEADEIVERATGAVGVDQRFVDLARVAHRVLHRLLGHRVEHHAVDALVLEDPLGLENLVDVPGNRLAFAVGVGGEDQRVGVLDGAADLAEALGGLGVDLPAHVEIVVRVDRAVLGREVADVPERSVHVISLAQVLVDGFCLGGRLDDDDLHESDPLAAPAYGRFAPKPQGGGARLIPSADRDSGPQTRRRPLRSGAVDAQEIPFVADAVFTKRDRTFRVRRGPLT